MFAAIIIVFIIGYSAIVLEHPLHLNKTASALLTGTICWAIIALTLPPDSFFLHEKFVAFVGSLDKIPEGFAASFKAFTEKTGTEEAIALTSIEGIKEVYAHFVEHELGHHIIEIAQILFFLLGAMTIVELVDAHGGFSIITSQIKTKDAVKLMWVVCFVTFFLSALLDNLTTSIVMVTLLRKLISDREQRMFYVGMVVISANAGGAWSPIGDVTTTMLWIGGQISTAAVISMVFVPSVVCTLVPLLVLTFTLKGSIAGQPEAYDEHHEHGNKAKDTVARNVMFVCGVGGLIFVPAFKTITHLPPYVGMMLSLGFCWLVSEIMNKNVDESIKSRRSVAYALSRIDASSILFFLGILLSVGALQSLHLLTDLAIWADNAVGNLDVIVMAIGLGSAIIDNVPLVAAAMGMYSVNDFPMDHKLWEFMAYCAGTGGSCLIIGSAAGVAVMGMEKIDFMWYLRKISWLALAGYLAGAFTYLAIYSMTHGVV